MYQFGYFMKTVNEDIWKIFNKNDSKLYKWMIIGDENNFNYHGQIPARL